MIFPLEPSEYKSQFFFILLKWTSIYVRNKIYKEKPVFLYFVKLVS